MLRILFATAGGAVIWGVLGLVLVFSLPPDPIGYIGAGCMILAVVVAIVAIVRSPTPMTIVVGVIAIVPLGLLVLALWMLANDPS